MSFSFTCGARVFTFDVWRDDPEFVIYERRQLRSPLKEPDPNGLPSVEMNVHKFRRCLSGFGYEPCHIDHKHPPAADSAEES